MVDIWAAFGRSAKLGLAVMVLTVLISLPAGYAFRRGFRGATAVFYTAVASLIVPSIVVSLGIGVQFRLIDETVKWAGERFGVAWIAEGFSTSAGMFTSGLGAHLTWTLPFGLLIMFAVFNRFDRRYEEAARDLGATPWQTVRHVVLPIIAPSLVGIGLFGFTLSWDEVARSSQAFGSDQNTLPLELTGLTTTITNPEIYALGTVTTGVSFLMIAVSLLLIQALRRSRARRAPAERRMTADGDPRRQSQYHGVDDGQDPRGRGKAWPRRGTRITAVNPETGPAVDRGLLRRGARGARPPRGDRQGRGARRRGTRHRLLRRHGARRRARAGPSARGGDRRGRVSPGEPRRRALLRDHHAGPVRFPPSSRTW